VLDGIVGGNRTIYDSKYLCVENHERTFIMIYCKTSLTWIKLTVEKFSFSCRCSLRNDNRNNVMHSENDIVKK
jgi:hypothetical protein